MKTKIIKRKIQKFERSKGGQYYVFAGLIFVFLAFSVVNAGSRFLKKNIESQQYLDNYKSQANIIIDNAVYENKNISYELRNYTEEFINYGIQKNLDFKILYLYSHNHYIYIVNYVGETVTLSDYDLNLQNNQNPIYF